MPHERIEFTELTVEEVRPLRTQVLRPGFEADELASFDGDEAPTSRHYGLRPVGEEPTAVVSYLRQSPPTRLESPAVRLRGMAVAADHRRRGLGRRLLQSSLTRLAADQPNLAVVWCNARISAAGFYRKEGFDRLGDPFEVEGIGEHVFMWRAMPRVIA